MATPIPGLPLHDWPEVDRAAWFEAIAIGDILDGRGAAVHWAKATRKTNIAHYGRWLGFLSATNRLNRVPPIGQRVIPSVVKEYIESLKLTSAPRTVVSTMVGLKVMLNALAPELNWRWLADLCNYLNRTAQPQSNKRQRIRPVEEIFAAAISKLEQMYAGEIIGRNQLCECRNTLMVAFLAARPLRLKNFTALEIGRHLISTQSDWLITIPAHEVKNRQPLDYDLPDILGAHVSRYILEIRPLILGNAPAGASLWVGWKKTTVSPREIYHCITRQTKKLLGAALNPHLFRDCAATSLSLVSPGAALAAAPLLGQRNFSTTARYYIQANQIQTSRKINDALDSIKSSLK